VCTEEKDMRIRSRKDKRLGTDNAVIAQRLWTHFCNLPCPAAVASYLATEHSIGIERVWRGDSIRFYADRMPVVKCDLTIVAATGDTGRPTILLAATSAPGKGVVHRDMEHLCGRLVVPSGPTHAAIERDDRALITGQKQNFRVVRVNPHALIIIATWSPA